MDLPERKAFGSQSIIALPGHWRKSSALTSHGFAGKKGFLHRASVSRNLFENKQILGKKKNGATSLKWTTGAALLILFGLEFRHILVAHIEF